MMKKGLVLEGGAMRGLFTAGVIDEMMRQDITFDGLIGVSAGAAFGCNFKSHQIGRVLRYNKRFAHEKNYCSLYSLLKTGDLYGADFCYHKLPDELDVMDTEAWAANPMAFYVTCTDVHTGKPVYHELGQHLDDEAYEWMRASASMPVASRPVHIDDMDLLDGGISDSIPLKYFQSIGYTKNVVVLTQPRDYQKQPQKGMKLLSRMLKDYPAVIDGLKDRYARYNDTLAYIREEEKAGNVFVIAPPRPLHIGSTEHDPVVMEEVYAVGQNTMKAKMKEMRLFLKE